MSSISSDLYEEILKPNTSHIIVIIQIVPCKTTLRGTNKMKFYEVNEVLQSRTKYLEQNRDSSKIGQEKKSLIFSFACFFNCNCQILIS